MKLNLGCGKNYLEGWINADLDYRVKADVHFNANFRNPYPDNTFDEVLAESVLEHLEGWPWALREIHRVCKPFARVVVDVPYFTGTSAVSDPQHVRFFSWHTFDTFRKRFHITQWMYFHKGHRLLGIQAFANTWPDVYEAYLSGLFPAWGIRFEMIVKKEEGENVVRKKKVIGVRDLREY